MPVVTLTDRIEWAIVARESLFDERHQAGLRLFNGFLEGEPQIVIDLYATTAVVHNYADPPKAGEALVEQVLAWLPTRLPWLEAILVKTRHSDDETAQNGVLRYGTNLATRIREHGVWYALDLTMNRDASLYLDTRNLRQWILANLADKTVLNTFAYTGSLGVAAVAAGAKRVVQTDRNRRFLNVAKTSHTLNGFPIHKPDFQTDDFWLHMNKFKRKGELFDCVIVDPPMFAATDHGVVDLAQNYTKVLNRVRPLMEHNGTIIAINNALFLSGEEYLALLEKICADGYVEVAQYIDIAEDFTGYPTTRLSKPITNPAPFNHSTKIAVLKTRRRGF